jgi:hypothetical protein
VPLRQGAFQSPKRSAPLMSRTWIAILIGSTIGGFVPALWGGEMLSYTGVLWSGIGAIAGLWVANMM